MAILNVEILIFNEVEVLDFAGPFEVFSLAEQDSRKLYNVYTIAERTDIVHARNGLKIQPDFCFENHPDMDIQIIPGGYGAEHIEIKNEHVLEWIKKQFLKVRLILSVCTGALLLAESGILNNRKATTHWMDISRLEQDYPNIKVIRNTRFVDLGTVITSGGISAGIDMSFYVLKKLSGVPIAKRTAQRMEYKCEFLDMSSSF
ncbi:DJ-1/PfpI family protein [uncultured Draconibacterium sp.]|uniref:DJ-1/PfpI family protein n=1 Tax=uncultured Draconibacterium sp. TaxID=1573823 RepID=UPI0029C922FB|nr:DJ-1/PfpI family protein [uncultured Draconibacterium sp.]